MPFYYQVKKNFENGILTICGREVVEVEVKSPREALKKLEEISRNWPQAEDGTSPYLSPKLYGPFDSRKEAEEAP